MQIAGWSVVYEKAIRADGSLFFPEKLSHEFLNQIRKTMGSYMFANQYLNEVIPDGDQTFKKEWIKYYSERPEIRNTFAFIDPAISQEEGADYTAVVVVDISIDGSYYVRVANRYRLTPTQIINMCFKIQEEFKCLCIGIEDVAYQKALLHMLDSEMRRRKMVLPIKGCRPGNDESKEYRIRGLVPRFEWNRVFLNKGLHDLEMELVQFPRGKHDDLIDSLAYIEQIAIVPIEPKKSDKPPNISQGAEYEQWYRKQLSKRATSENDGY